MSNIKKHYQETDSNEKELKTTARSEDVLSAAFSL